MTAAPTETDEAVAAQMLKELEATERVLRNIQWMNTKAMPARLARARLQESALSVYQRWERMLERARP